MCFSYLGFDAGAMLSEETPNPKKTIPQAIFLVALIGGVMFTATSYFIQAVFPTLEGFKLSLLLVAPEFVMYVSCTLFQIVF